MALQRTEVLQAALVGYQARRDEIDRRIQEVQAELNGAAVAGGAEQKPERKLSPAGRRRLIAATKKRWRDAKKAGRSTL